MESNNIPSKHSRRRGSSSLALEKEDSLEGNYNNSNYENDVSMFSDVKCCYYLFEAMPLPGPTWSTTGPSVLAEPPSLAILPPIEASLGLEWEESHDSSYTWWMGFLEGLDGNIMTTKKKTDLPFVEHSKGFSNESKIWDENAIDLGCCPDDWLMIPTMEKDLGDY